MADNLWTRTVLFLFSSFECRQLRSTTVTTQSFHINISHRCNHKQSSRRSRVPRPNSNHPSPPRRTRTSTLPAPPSRTSQCNLRITAVATTYSYDSIPWTVRENAYLASSLRPRSRRVVRRQLPYQSLIYTRQTTGLKRLICVKWPGAFSPPGALSPFSREKLCRRRLSHQGPTALLPAKDDSTTRDRLASCLATHGHHLVISHLFFLNASTFSSRHASSARMAGKLIGYSAPPSRTNFPNCRHLYS
ncbi:hypothetical protein V8E53_003620 [Lactarius tabidus]|jgi:hypothetical protein